ncbi:MAG: single-stranded DNA-binding protein [Alphaproteobacteria bacterium]|nr:single-stranded DNA-binding protein [Alphaproteobacteria bacterium]
MDRAQFELIGNVGKIEIKPIKDSKKFALISLATSERWKTESGDWNEKSYWHRVAIFAPAKVALIETAVQKGARLRLVGQIRPGS